MSHQMMTPDQLQQNGLKLINDYFDQIKSLTTNLITDIEALQTKATDEGISKPLIDAIGVSLMLYLEKRSNEVQKEMQSAD